MVYWYCTEQRQRLVVHGQWHRGGWDRDGYLMDVGKKCFWLVLVSSGKFWLVLASYGSKGDNFLFKNYENFEIHQKFNDIG